MKKNLGSKRKFIPSDKQNKLLKIYQDFEESEFSKIYSNEFFGYTKVTLEEPLMEDDVIVTDCAGKPKPDSSERDFERIHLLENIEEFYDREVKPHLYDSWMDRTKDKIDYEINFTKYSCNYKPLRSLEENTNDILELESGTEDLTNQILK